MREILSIALVLAVAGLFVVTVMALSLALSRTIDTATDVTNNGMTSLKVSLPSDMKHFPAELVPLP
jgi:hypothetical protein